MSWRIACLTPSFSSYNACGGNGGFWSGNFGDSVADLRARTDGATSRAISRALLRRRLIDDKNVGYDIDLDRFNDGTVVEMSVDGGTFYRDASGMSLEQVEDMYREFDAAVRTRRESQRQAELDQAMALTKLDKMITITGSHGEGYRFRVRRQAEDDFRGFLRAHFRTGSASFYHWKTAQCGTFGGGCRDFRNDPGTLPFTGSMQVTYNAGARAGYLDVDRYSPFSGPRGFLNHLFKEVLSGSGVPEPSLFNKIDAHRRAF